MTKIQKGLVFEFGILVKVTCGCYSIIPGGRIILWNGLTGFGTYRLQFGGNGYYQSSQLLPLWGGL